MVRPRTPLSSHGTISSSEVAPGKWRARTRYRYEDGSLRQVERFSTSRSKALRSLATAIASIDASQSGTLTGSTTLEILSQRYIESKSGERTTAGTLSQYKRTLERNVLPRVGRLTIAEATPERLQRVLDDVTKVNGPGAAKSCKSILSGMLALAVRNGAARTNPVRELERIRQKREGAEALSLDQLHALLVAVRGDARLRELDLVDVIEFMAATGCRVGEALALRWKSVDLVTSTVTLNATVVRIMGEGLLLQEHGKTEASGRTIVISDDLLSILDLRMLERIDPTNELVFPTVTGKLRDPQNTDRDWRLARRRLELGEVKLHAFRKTIATVLDTAGLSARDIAEYLGHKNPSMTQDRYMSKTAGTARAAAVLSGLTKV
jgi:integrase